MVYEFRATICMYVYLQCFMEPLKKVQVEGHLMFAEPHELFGNLDELCYVRSAFVTIQSKTNLMS